MKQFKLCTQNKVLLLVVVLLGLALFTQMFVFADTTDYYTGYQELPEDWFGYTQLYYDNYGYDLEREDFYLTLSLENDESIVFVSFKYYLDYSNLDDYTGENTVYMYCLETDELHIFDRVTGDVYFSDWDL